MGQTIPAMKAMQLLAPGGIAVAAGAMISFSFAVSPPLTLVPQLREPSLTLVRQLPEPLNVTFDANANATAHRSSETVGAASTDTFERRWQPTDEAPLSPVPRRNLLEGLVGGLLTLPIAQDAPQFAQVDLNDFAEVPQSEKQESATAALREPVRRSDVCARRGLHKINYTQNRHRYWRCVSR